MNECSRNNKQPEESHKNEIKELKKYESKIKQTKPTDANKKRRRFPKTPGGDKFNLFSL